MQQKIDSSLAPASPSLDTEQAKTLAAFVVNIRTAISQQDYRSSSLSIHLLAALDRVAATTKPTQEVTVDQTIKGSITFNGYTDLPNGQKGLLLDIRDSVLFHYNTTDLVSAKLCVSEEGKLYYLPGFSQDLKFACWSLTPAAELNNSAAPILLTYRSEGDYRTAAPPAIEFIHRPLYRSSTTWAVRVASQNCPFEAVMSEQGQARRPPVLKNQISPESPLPRVSGSSYAIYIEECPTTGTPKLFKVVPGNADTLITNGMQQITIKDGALTFNTACYIFQDVQLPCPMEISTSGDVTVDSNVSSQPLKSNSFLVNPYGRIYAFINDGNRAKYYRDIATGLSCSYFNMRLYNSDREEYDRVRANVLDPFSYYDIYLAEIKSVFGKEVAIRRDPGANGLETSNVQYDPATMKALDTLYHLLWDLRHKLCAPNKLFLHVKEIELHDTQAFVPGIESLNAAASAERDSGIVRIAKPGLNLSAISHEFAHILEGHITNSEDPAFIKRWKKLSDGLLGYREVPGDLPSLRDGLAYFIHRFYKKLRPNTLPVGIISDYAQKNIYEDIAVMVAKAITDPHTLKRIIEAKPDKDRKALVGKVRLLHEFGFIADQSLNVILNSAQQTKT